MLLCIISAIIYVLHNIISNILISVYSLINIIVLTININAGHRVFKSMTNVVARLIFIIVFYFN